MDYKKFAAGLRAAAGSYALFDGAPRGDLEKAADVIEELAAKLEPSSEPLTLEELRGMDGEPVWNDTTKKWAIVDIYSQFGPRAIIQGGRWRPLDDRYYRHRPEGEKIGGNRQ